MTWPVPFDPHFPHRPMTTDLALLAELMRDLDTLMDKTKPSLQGAKYVEITREAIDPDSLAYMTNQRAMRVSSVVPEIAPFHDILELVWREGFILGARFANAGGKSPIAVDGDVCVSCHKAGTNERPLAWAEDPFKAEVDREIENGWWHEECFDTRKDDV